ncbi:MAG: glycerol kinase GlpK [Phycisphaerae bacterium]|nr:glycerol kinase GlpK [Phycisphaerae bacterium]MDW8262063.1 glycerol kinase GlpK [Phycisphaerales bacterium]
MSQATHILAIDQSTSATKAIVLDASGAVISRCAREHRQIYPRPGWVEHDAEEIWQNTLSVIGGVDLSGIAFLSLTNQRETFVVFDRATGRPLHNAIVWQDRRGSAICQELVRCGHEALIARKTGLRVDTYFSGSKLGWLVRNEPEIAARLADGSALAGTIDTYLIYRLTEGKVFATDHTNASRTLLLDINTLRWDEQLCGLFDVPLRALPELRDSTAGFGEARLSCKNQTVTLPIVGVMGDSQAALLAHRCLSAGSAKVTLGTGSSVLLNIGAAPRAADDGTVTTIAWTHRATATYCFEGIVNYSAATIEWLRNQLGLIRDAAETEALATAVPDNGGVYLVPAFVGLGAPHWSPGARAAIVGLSAHSNRNHVVRAALESIAYQIHDALDAMRRQAGVTLQTIHADGGATRNAFLMQFIADITGVSIAAAEMPDCSPLGAAMAGMLGSGVVTSMDELSRLPHRQTLYQPRMPQAQAEALRSGWRRAVRQVLAGVEG